MAIETLRQNQFHAPRFPASSADPSFDLLPSPKTGRRMLDRRPFVRYVPNVNCCLKQAVMLAVVVACADTARIH